MKSKEYFALENLSPYSQVNLARLKNPKQNFQWCADFLEENIFIPKIISPDSEYKIVDVGCANGEFLNYYSSRFKNHACNKVGLDLTPKFIEVAKSLKIKNTSFFCCDIFNNNLEYSNRFNITTCFGTVPVFKD